MAPVRPSLAEPEPATRNVVHPIEAIEGRRGPPPPPPGSVSDESGRAEPAPTAPPQVGASERGTPTTSGREPIPPRPTFVDPDPADDQGAGSVYEETLGVPRLFERPAGPDPGGSAPRRERIPVLVVAAVIVALLVVGVAALLIVGVI
jgi:hypothetical protein